MSLFLLDTHILLWAAGLPERLPARARALIEDARNPLAFSAASIWEVAIKAGLGCADFQADPRRLRRGLLEAGYREMAVTGEHAAALARLPPIHKDPFDRMLVVQAEVEGAVLVTADPLVARYGGDILLVG